MRASPPRELQFVATQAEYRALQPCTFRQCRIQSELWGSSSLLVASSLPEKLAARPLATTRTIADKTKLILMSFYPRCYFFTGSNSFRLIVLYPPLGTCASWSRCARAALAHPPLVTSSIAVLNLLPVLLPY